MVSGRSQNPSRKPRTAISAASRPPLVLPIPSAIAATTSRRGSGNSGPKTAPAKSSLRLRRPVSETNPTLTLRPETRSAIAAAPISAGRAGGLDHDAVTAQPGITASVLQSATMIEEIAAGARRDHYREFLGFAVERVVAAVRRVVPRNLGVADAGRIGIHRASVVIDLDLPIRTAGHIGAGDRGLAALRFSAGRGGRHTGRQRANSRRQPAQNCWPQQRALSAYFIVKCEFSNHLDLGPVHDS